VPVTACTSVAQVPAPNATPLHGAAAEQIPYIQAVTARILMKDGMPTNDVSFDINAPDTYITGRWAGNIIYYLDVKLPDTPGKPATSAEGTYKSTFDSEFITWDNLSPGNHTFLAQLVTSDLFPLDPHMHASVDLGVPAQMTDKPFISSLSVETMCRPGYVPRGMSGGPKAVEKACADLNLVVRVKNFNIVADKTGQTAVPGEGHFVYYFNVDPPTTAGKPALTEKDTYAVSTDGILSWFGVDPGEYKVWVQLVNNDNTPLEPAVTAGAVIIVPEDAGRYLGL